MRINIPTEKRVVHEMVMPIRWGDMDAFRHVNNAVYFRYMEQARIEWITSLGFSCTAEKEAMIMVNGFCNFYKQVSFPASLRVSTFVGQIGNSTVDLINTMELIEASADQGPVLCADGGATMLWVDLEKNKSMPWPESILKVLR